MSKKIDEQSQAPYLTPSTRKLMKLREGKGPGMLNDEEIELLRMSQREISIGSSIASQSLINNADILGFIGILSDKTHYKATLEEIEIAIQDGWTNYRFNAKK